MTWKKPSPELIAFLDEALAGFQTERKKMFGSPVHFVNGNMFAAVHQDSLFVRLSEADRKELLSSNDEAALFEPMEGRKMREYVVIPDSIYNDPTEFPVWLNRGYEYVASLPPKEPKRRKKKA